MAASLENPPRFFELLNDWDKEQYLKLRRSIHGRPLPLADKMIQIRAYCQSPDGNEWKRYLVCGICWLTTGELALNFHNLRILTNSSRSTMNNDLLKSGYVTIPMKSCDLINQIPYLEEHPVNLRDWTIKSFAPVTPQPAAPVIDGLSSTIWSSVSPEPSMNKLDDVITVEDLRVIEKKQIEEDFWDDPFCLPPVFLLEDQRSCLCACK